MIPSGMTLLNCTPDLYVIDQQSNLSLSLKVLFECHFYAIDDNFLKSICLRQWKRYITINNCALIENLLIVICFRENICNSKFLKDVHYEYCHPKIRQWMNSISLNDTVHLFTVHENLDSPSLWVRDFIFARNNLHLLSRWIQSVIKLLDCLTLKLLV